MDTLPFAAVDTYIKNRKLMPSFITTLKHSESDFKSNNNGTIAIHWQDTKEVLLLSNCHTGSMGQIKKKKKKTAPKSPPPAPQLYCFTAKKWLEWTELIKWLAYMSWIKSPGSGAKKLFIVC